MHTIFYVASKLLGVYFIYLGFIYLVTAFALGDGVLAPVLLQVLSAAVAFAFAVVLVSRTDRLGRVIGIAADAGASVRRLESGDAVRMGIILIGVYVFVTRVALVLNIVSSYLGGVRFGGPGGALVRILVECVPLILALLFIFRADRVVDLINRA